MPNDPFRVVQAGLIEDNRSVWLSDGPLGAPPPPGRGRGGILAVIPSLPASVAADYTPSGRERMPTGTAVYYRMVEFMPETVYEARPELAPKDADGKIVDVRHRHFGMHATATVDIITIVSGEVWSYQDDEAEGKLLKQGDTIILRGSLHSWHNTGTDSCVAACVNVYADGGLAAPGGFLPRAEFQR